jgi:hypothetical protein
MTEIRNPNLVPVGPGGTLGRIGRMIVMVFTGGMAYPNVFVEGMDCTAIQKEYEGSLYHKKDKKVSPSKSGEMAKTPGTQQASASA